MRTPTRRATDMNGAPIRDRVKWHTARACEKTQRYGPSLLIVVAIILAVLSLRQSNTTADTSTDRDQARTFQICEQRFDQAVATNSTNGVVRASLLTAYRLRLAEARVAESPALGRRYLRAARAAKRRRDRVKLVNPPDCDAQYPEGARLSPLYPDAAKTLPTPERPR